MGSNINFKSFGNEPPVDNGGGGRPPGNFPLSRQPSIYSLTFDELMSTMGGTGKDFGSMNMDELLKNIWTAEEYQLMASSSSGGGQEQGGVVPGGNLQRQGSLTLPRTLSNKTVDEVWKDISKDYGAGKDGSGDGGGSNLPQRQQTLGEMTLEEFLFRAGVGSREDTQLETGGGVFADLTCPVSNSGLGASFQPLFKGTGMMGKGIQGNNDQITIQPSTNSALHVNGVRSNQQQQQSHSLTPPQQPPPQIFPKQPAGPYVSQLNSPSSGQHLGNPGIRGGIVGVAEKGLNGSFIQSSALQGGGLSMVGLGAGSAAVATGSPANQLAYDGIGKNSGDSSSVSPVPYAFNGGLRGRKSNGALEKVVERRQRRMIKNRESAARSRARKQAYTMELEAEVAKLKEENEELRRKQAEFMEMQKNQAMEMKDLQRGAKKICLRRTQSGPW